MNAVSKYLAFALMAFVLVPSERARSGSDWTDWRGPARNGISLEKGLPTQWSPKGDNLVWKAPYGGRSTPIIMGERLFLFNSAGEGGTMQERVIFLIPAT